MLNDYIKELFIIENDESDREIMEIENSVHELLDIASHTDDPVLYRKIIREIKEAADNYLKDNDPVGYWILSHWYGLCGEYGKALGCNYVAAQKGISQSINEINRLEEAAEKDGHLSLSLAETCFVVGDDEKGEKWLEKAIALEPEVGELGAKIRKNGNLINLNTHLELPYVVSKLKLRLFKQVILSYKDLDIEYYGKAIFFLKGVAFGLGVEISIDEDKKKVVLSHGCRERVLKEKENGGELLDIGIKSFDDGAIVANKLLAGASARIDFSECPYEDAIKAFDYINGVCISLEGTVKKEEDLFVYSPKLMEYQGLSTK